MKTYERRQTGSYPYFKLATWDPRSFTWRDGKKAFPTEDDARREARSPGQYRLSVVTETGRSDLPAFTVAR